MRAATLFGLLLSVVTGTSASAMELTSPDLAQGGKVPLSAVYTRCGGSNISPAFAWAGAPASTRSFVITLIDQDVKPALWSHWIVVDVPAGTTRFEQGAALPSGARALTSDFGDAHFDGPCPPPGSGVHHYRLSVWAMPEAHEAPDNRSAAALSAWLKSRALASASLTTYFER